MYLLRNFDEYKPGQQIVVALKPLYLDLVDRERYSSPDNFKLNLFRAIKRFCRTVHFPHRQLDTKIDTTESTSETFISKKLIYRKSE